MKRGDAILEWIILADHDKENLTQLRSLIYSQYHIRASIYEYEQNLLSQLSCHTGDGTLFIRIDDLSLAALKLSAMARMFYPRVQVVWMSKSDQYALDAFARGVDAYLLLPASRENIAEAIHCLEYKKQRHVVAR